MYRMAPSIAILGADTAHSPLSFQRCGHGHPVMIMLSKDLEILMIERICRHHTPPLKAQISKHEESSPDTMHESEMDGLRRGLHASKKFVPCSFLYNEEGSKLYDEITEVSGYPTFNKHFVGLCKSLNADSCEFLFPGVV